VTARIARLRENARSEAGLSLTELLVTIMLTAIVMTMVGSMFINVARITSNSNVTTTKSSTAANLMDAVSKVIRTASNIPVAGSDVPNPAIVAGTSSTLTLYSYVDTNSNAPEPTKVGYRVDAKGNLVEDRWKGSSAGGNSTFVSTATSRVLGGPILTPSGSQALFTYIDSAGNVADTSTDFESVASIRVTIGIANQLTTGSDPILLINTIGMPNLKLARDDT